VDYVLVVQVSQAGESVSYDSLFGGWRKCRAIDMEQGFLEIREDQDGPMRNAVYCCSDVGGVLYMLL